MKYTMLYLLAGLLIISNTARSQSWIGSGGNLTTDARTQHVGIDDKTPVEKLTVNGNIGFTESIHIRSVRGLTSSYLELLAKAGYGDGAGILLGANGMQGFDGMLRFVSGGAAGGSRAFEFVVYDNAAYTNLMYGLKDGKVVMGNVSTPGNYRLYVQNGILTEKVRVANSQDGMNWADFVFEEGYQLPGIYEVEQFIKERGHLPDIPSAEEVARDGIDLGAMDAKLLQKIEELTLYVIQLQKEIDALKKAKN